MLLDPFLAAEDDIVQDKEKKEKRNYNITH